MDEKVYSNLIRFQPMPKIKIKKTKLAVLSKSKAILDLKEDEYEIEKKDKKSQKKVELSNKINTIKNPFNYGSK